MVGLVVASPIYAQATSVNVTVSQQKIDADNEGVKQDLVVNVQVHLICSGQSSVGNALTVSTTLSDPSGTAVGSETLTNLTPGCGLNSFTFILKDVLTSSGMFTITTTADVGSLSASDSHSFDPHVDGSLGPL